MDLKPIIEFDDFDKLDIRIGTIKKATKLENSDKLLKLIVSFEDEEKQILSGIANFYDPKDLEGKQCPFLVNISPRKLRGEISEGMILAGDVEGKAVLMHPDKEIPANTKIL